MSLEACAGLVAEGDPDRFAATMAAPVAARSLLWPLYAINLEIARAPWASAEPMVAEMRLQWWINTIGELAGGAGRAGHPVTEALAPMLAADGVLADLLIGIAEARRWDCWREPFTGRADFDAYLDATSGNLMWAAARTLGAPAAAEPAIRDFAWGAGLSAYLRAVPELEARGRIPLVDGRPDALRRLAVEGRARMRRARASAIPRAARPALWSGASAERILALAEREPARVAEGTLNLSDFGRRWALLIRVFTGRI
ncbi:squalene/phytoene synthase family protein [Defluviimonas sp. SAOS-178_SWC]|uniref:squalene/phytoene synthase family protein n=1 Tax=Defluviimonas sp. SAOS-178_SWC TaxID=3121287 RepID=UPI003221CD95